MHKRLFIASYRLFFGALGLVALTAQYVYNAQHIPDYDPVNFFSFFTVESNILAALILLVAGFGALKNKRHDVFAFLRGAAAVYMVITGIVYVLLLSGLEESLQTAVPWINTVLHYILPVVVLLDWLIDPPEKPVVFSKALFWLSFPIVYTLYSLGRGALTGWYPYPFLNPTIHGYGGVAIMCLAILAGAVLIVWAVAGISRLRQPV